MVDPKVLQRALNAADRFKILSDITQVPSVVLITLWAHYDRCRLSVRMADKGFYHLKFEDWPILKIRNALFSFSRINSEEVEILARKGVGNFVLATIIAAYEFKRASRVLIYLNSPIEVLEETMRLYGGKELVDTFKEVLKLFNH